MTTITYKGVDYNLILVDPSISAGGDGSSVATAMKDFPTVLTDNTCYLIRRTDVTDGYCTVQYQPVNTGILHNILFLGMPKSTDDQWIQDLITDNTINTAWKADIATYANIKFEHSDTRYAYDVDNAVISDSTLEWCTGINLYCFRHYALDQYSDYYRHLPAMFSNGFDMDFKTKFGFYNCKFGTLYYDIDSDAWLASHDHYDLDDGTNKLLSQYGTNYVCAKRANSLTLKNCIVNAHSDCYGNDWRDDTDNTIYEGHAFNSNGIIDVTIEDCTVNGVRQHSGSYRCGCFKFSNVSGLLSLHNVNYNLILTLEYLRPVLEARTYNRYGKIQVQNVQVRLKSFKTTTYTVSSLSNYEYFGGLYIGDDKGNYSNVADNISIKGYDVNCSSGSIKLAEGNFLNLISKIAGNGTPYANVVKNVSIIMHDNPEECFLPNVRKDLTTVNIDVNAFTDYDGNQHGTDYWYHGNTYDKTALLKLEDFYVKSLGAGYLSLVGVTANIARLHTGLVMRCSQLQIDEQIYNKRDDSAVVLIGSNNYLRIKNLVVSENRQGGTPIIENIFGNTDNTYSGQNNVYVDRCNQEEVFNLVTDSETSYRWWYSNAICANAGDTGKFIQRNRNSIAQSWSITRSASEAEASLKLMNNTASNGTKGLVVCPKPFKGFQITPTTTGNKNLVAYFAYRDFNTSDESTGKKMFRLEVDVPYEVSYHVYDTYTYVTDYWEVDDSEWSDPEAIARKFVLPINVTVANQPIDIRVTYNWFSNTGYVYFDPDIKLV